MADDDRYRYPPARIEPTWVDKPVSAPPPLPEVNQVSPWSPAGEVAAARQIAEAMTNPYSSGVQRKVLRIIAMLILAVIAASVFASWLD